MIQLFQVQKKFGGKVTALRNVTLEVKRGEFVLITGPSGAGKTTLLRTIFAAERPDAGEIVIAGRNISRLRDGSIPLLRRNIGVVFQDFKLIDELTVFENVAIALEIRGLQRREIYHRSMGMLTAVGLGTLAQRRASELSGGEQQRVAIARAIVGQPAIVLADEPTGNLDPERSHDILDLFAGIAQNGTAVVLATHDPMVVQYAAYHRLLRLENGTISGSQPGVKAQYQFDGPLYPELSSELNLGRDEKTVRAEAPTPQGIDVILDDLGAALPASLAIPQTREALG